LIVGVVATATHVSGRDLYVAATGAVCDGGSALSVCYATDAAEFNPPPPDLTSYEPDGFGYVDPAEVPGGRLYVARCQVQAIEVNGVRSSRAEFAPLTLLSTLAWALPLGVVLLIACALMFVLRREMEAAPTRCIRFAFVAQAAVALQYALLLVIASTGPRPYASAWAVVILSGVLTLVAVASLTLAVVLAVRLVLRPGSGRDLAIVVTQVGSALLLPSALIGVGALVTAAFSC
jgi:hypothetical protein